MSRLFINNNFETTDAPFTLSGTCSRSATNKINGTLSLRGGDSTAKDGQAAYVFAAADKLLVGSARALRVRFEFNLKRVTVPSGSNLVIVNMGPILLRILNGEDKLNVGSGGGTTGATTLGTGVRAIIYEVRWEGADLYHILTIDGASEVNLRESGTGGASSITSMVLLYVQNVNKTTWEHIIDDFKMYLYNDPQ